MDHNPIARLLGVEPGQDKVLLSIAGRSYELYPARPHNYTTEAMYRTDAGRGVSAPGFSLLLTPPHLHEIALGQYLAKPRDGVKQDEASEIVRAAFLELNPSIARAAEDYARNGRDRAMTRGAEMERRHAEKEG